MSKKKNYYSDTTEDFIFDMELTDFCFELEQFINNLAVNMLDVPYHLRKKDTKITYPLESYVTHVSHRNLQGAPENPSEKMTETKLKSTLLGQIDQRSIFKGHFPYRIRKDINSLANLIKYHIS